MLLCLTSRRSRIFLVNGTVLYGLTLGLESPRLSKERCKRLLTKSLYQFLELADINEQVQLRNQLCNPHLNDINMRRVRSDDNLHRGWTCDPWLRQPDFLFTNRYFSSLSSTINPHIILNIPQHSNGFCPPQTQMFLTNQNVQTIQSSYYLKRNNCANNNSNEPLNEISEIMKVLSKRSWHEVSNCKKHLDHHFEFTLMSYNVLAQNLLIEHSYLYKHHNPKVLNWPIRWKNLFNEIKTIQPDILCLQEVQESHLVQYYSQLQTLGYQGFYKKRTGIRCDGCAIYYKTDKLNLVEYETVEFYQPGIDVLNRDNIAIIAKFCPKHDSRRHFIVATTHLLYNPKRQDVRLAQTQLLLAEVERMSFHWNSEGIGKYWPIIITGDFNATPDSAVYTLITKGTLKYKYLAAKRMHQPESPRQGNVLVPSLLGITDQCQHASLVQKRHKDEDIPRTEEVALIKLYNSDKKNKKYSSEVIKNSELFSSGTLSHLFALKSVYNHGETENPEGSTFQNEWITVDYIFYSGKKQNDHIEDHKLKLLSLFKLPLRSELGSLKIPNQLMGSDHLSLVARFGMKL